jgi:hypothetical protein
MAIIQKMFVPIDPEVKRKIRASKNMLKGRTAEVLVEELFRLIGYQVHRYGMEHSVPTLLRDLQDFRGHKIIDRVRTLPDFIITKGTNALEIEVKYRESGQFRLSDVLAKYAAYEHVEALFVIVSPHAVKCISFDELQKGSEITSSSAHHLHDRPEFSQDGDIIRYYTGYVVNVLTKGLKNLPQPDS